MQHSETQLETDLRHALGERGVPQPTGGVTFEASPAQSWTDVTCRWVYGHGTYRMSHERPRTGEISYMARAFDEIHRGLISALWRETWRRIGHTVRYNERSRH